MADWQQRYRNMKGDWPHPDSSAGRSMSCHDFYKLERIQRAKNVMQAIWFAKNKLIFAVQEETDEALDDVLSGILPGILMALVTVASTTLVGFSLGALGGAVAGAGVGSVPGAVAGSTLGFSAGMWILEWMGLAFLAGHVGKNMYQVGRLVEQGFNDAWGRGAQHWSSMSYHSEMMSSHHDAIPGFLHVTNASEKFARAVAVLGNGSNASGSFWTRELPATEVEWRSNSAVQGQRNGDGSYVSIPCRLVACRLGLERPHRYRQRCQDTFSRAVVIRL